MSSEIVQAKIEIHMEPDAPHRRRWHATLTILRSGDTAPTHTHWRSYRKAAAIDTAKRELQRELRQEQQRADIAGEIIPIDLQRERLQLSMQLWIADQ